MKRYLIALLIITSLEASQQKGVKRKLIFTDSPYGRNPKRHQPSAPFPVHVENEEDDDDYDYDDKYECDGLYFPQQAAPPIPESSILLQRRKTQKPFNPDYTPAQPTPQTTLSPEQTLRNACAQCTASYCKGQGWCNEHR